MSGPFFAEDAPVSPTAYPRSPGWKARETAKAAAGAMAPKAGLLRDRVLAAIRLAPSTPDEVATHLGETVLAVRPRVSELSKLGKVIDTGQRRKNASGRPAIVWKAV